jgi:hypothetical protein
MNIIIEILKKFWKEILIGMLLIFSFFAIRQCNDNKLELKIQKHNALAALDSVRYYYTKNGELYAEKMAFITTQNKLEEYNKELSDNVKELNKKLNIALNTKVIVKDTIKLPGDTIWISNEVTEWFESKLAIKDSVLDGILSYQLQKDYLLYKSFDYTIQLPLEIYVTKDDQFIVKSINNARFPYISGYIDRAIASMGDVQKPKRWSIGVGAGFGGQYGILNKKFDVGPYVGISFGYSIFRW